jgi:hypothetical protein
VIWVPCLVLPGKILKTNIITIEEFLFLKGDSGIDMWNLVAVMSINFHKLFQEFQLSINPTFHLSMNITSWFISYLVLL